MTVDKNKSVVDIEPKVDSSLSLGSTAKRWLNIWGDLFNGGTLSGNNTGDQDLINRFSSTITYSGNFVDTVTNNSIVTTYTNDGDKYTSWTDGTNTWTPVYDGTSGLLTSIGVT